MEKYLFGAIFVLLLSITGIGAYAAIQHPAETASLVPETVSVVQTALVNATSGVTHPPAEVKTDSSATSEKQVKVTPPVTQAPGTYTMAQVKAHDSSSSCFTVVNGLVYDLTSFIGQHPGGSAAILSLCGTDGTAAFTEQHGGERRPANELASLKIGTLVK